MERQLIEPMIFDVLPDVKSRGEPLQEPMEFFEPSPQNNINEYETLVSPMDFFDEAQINCTQFIPDIINTKGHYTTSPASAISGINYEVGDLENERNVEKATSLKGIYEKDTELSPYVTMQQLSNKLGIIVVGDNTIYLYNGKYYKLSSIADLDREIVKNFRSLIKIIGVPKFVNDVSSFVLKEPKLNVKSFPVSQTLVSFENGLLNLTTGKMQLHSKEYFTLYSIKANYLNNYGVACPRFDAFLENITRGDEILVKRIWQMIGYILTPDTSAKTFFLLQGVQNSGKTVLTTIISELFSEDAVATLDIHSYGEKFSVSELFGKSLAISPDLPAEPLDSKAVGKIKQITGNDTISAPVKYKSNLQFKSTAKIILATNHPLLLKMHDDAFFDRLVTIPFKYSVPKSEQCFTLIDDLLSERDAIVTKAINYYFDLVAHNYCFIGEYMPNRVVMNGIFIEENVRMRIFKFVQNFFTKDDDGVVFMTDAYDRYIKKNTYISLNEFSQYFKRYAEEIYNGRKERKRKENEENAKSCIRGINWKEDFNNDLYKF